MHNCSDQAFSILLRTNEGADLNDADRALVFTAAFGFVNDYGRHILNDLADRVSTRPL